VQKMKYKAIASTLPTGSVLIIPPATTQATTDRCKSGRLS